MFSLFENKQRINERANEDRKIRIDSEKKCWYTMGGKVSLVAITRLGKYKSGT